MHGGGEAPGQPLPRLQLYPTGVAAGGCHQVSNNTNNASQQNPTIRELAYDQGAGL